MKRIWVPVLALAWLVAGCSGAGTASERPTTSVTPRPAVFDESQVANYLHLKNGVYTAPNGQRCETAVVLTSASQVTMYADAGDTVATNPAGTAGVKIVDAETATCLRLLTAALAKFPTR